MLAILQEKAQNLHLSHYLPFFLINEMFGCLGLPAFKN